MDSFKNILCRQIIFKEGVLAGTLNLHMMREFGL